MLSLNQFLKSSSCGLSEACTKSVWTVRYRLSRGSERGSVSPYFSGPFFHLSPVVLGTFFTTSFSYVVFLILMIILITLIPWFIREKTAYHISHNRLVCWSASAFPCYIPVLILIFTSLPTFSPIDISSRPFSLHLLSLDPLLSFVLP